MSGLLNALGLKPKTKGTPPPLLPDAQAQSILFRAGKASSKAREAGLDLGGKRDTLRKEIEDLTGAKDYAKATTKLVAFEAQVDNGLVWPSRLQELADTRAQAQQLLRTGDGKADQMLNVLATADREAQAGHYTSACQLLDGAKTALAKRLPEWRLVRVHNCEMGKLKPRLDNAIAAIPGRSDNRHALHPQWQAVDAALAGSPVTVTDTNTIAAKDLEARRQTFAGALDQLTKAYGAMQLPNGPQQTAQTEWGKKEASALREQYSTLFQKAKYVQPRTGDQEELLNEFLTMPQGGATWAELLGRIDAKAAKAEQLLRSVQRAEPLPDEKAYFRAYSKISGLVKAAIAETAKPAKTSMADMMKAIDDKAKQPDTPASKFVAQWATFSSILESWNDDRYTKCLALLPALKLAAAAAMKAKQDAALELVGRLNEDPNFPPVEDAPALPATSDQIEQNAIAATQTIDPAVLKMLPSDKKMELLTALRANGGPPPFDENNPNADDPARVAQRAIYAAMDLDERFVEMEKTARQAFVDELMKDKAAMTKARDDWPLLSEAERVVVFEKIMRAHCKAMGFAEPKGTGKPFDIQLMHNADGSIDKATDAQYNPGTDTIKINKNSTSISSDFELMIDTIVHENSHNYQWKLIARLNKPDNDKDKLTSAEDPPYTQALMFAANWTNEGWVTGKENYAGYKKAPIEDHAWTTGPETARKLLKALSS